MKKLITAVTIVGGSIVGLAATAGAESPDDDVTIETVDHPVITPTSIIGAQSLTTIDGAIIVTDAAVTIPSGPGVTNGPSTSPHVAPPSSTQNPTNVPAPLSTGHHYGAALPIFTDIAWTLSQTNPWYGYAGGVQR